MQLFSWLLAPVNWLWTGGEYNLADPVSFSDVESSYFDRFAGEVVVEFSLPSAPDADAVSEIASTLLSDVWHLSAEKAVIRLGAGQLDDFQRLLPSPLPVSTIIGDVPRAVVTSYPLKNRRKDIRREFLAFEDAQLGTNTTIGWSWEGLPIGARITPNTDVLVICGLQGREWASVAFCQQLMGEHPDISVIPVANPDGYIYSWTTDRLWVKNRQPTGMPLCPGHDIASALFGADTSAFPACSDSWAGRGRQNPLEARSISDIASRFDKRIVVHGLAASPHSEAELRHGWSVVKLPDFGTGYLLPKRLLAANYEEIGATLKRLL